MDTIDQATSMIPVLCISRKGYAPKTCVGALICHPHNPCSFLMRSKRGASGTCQHSECVNQHKDRNKQSYTGKGGCAYFRNMSDIDSVYNVIK